MANFRLTMDLVFSEPGPLEEELRYLRRFRNTEQLFISTTCRVCITELFSHTLLQFQAYREYEIGDYLLSYHVNAVDMAISI